MYRQYGNRVASRAEAMMERHRMHHRWIVNSFVAGGKP
jgi:hypothetical protein